jgi:MoxR-like ATPase/predicted RNA-binding protein with PUA-like domain
MNSPLLALDGFGDPVLFTLNEATVAPTEAGVHVVLDSGGEAVYVGSTRNLRERLRQHLQGDREASVLHEQVGELLDDDRRVASRENIRDWLARCTVRWQRSDDPEGLKVELVAQLKPRFNRAAAFPRTGFWWVNQDRSFDQERTAGVVFASTNGVQVAHHLDVGRMVPGDVVVHYRRGEIVALGEVVAQPVQATHPYLLAAERDPGLLTKVEYFVLQRPIALSDLPERTGTEGPFGSSGAVKQGYLYPLAMNFADLLRKRFSNRWPAGSRWAIGKRRFWLFRANPEQPDLSQRLPSGQLGTNDWVAGRHWRDMRPGDGVVLWQSGPRPGIYALARLAGKPRLEPIAGYPPESAGAKEYRVAFGVERYVRPPITWTEVLAHPVMSGLEMLHQSLAGANYEMTEEQWRAVLQAVPIEPSTALQAGRWTDLVRWAERFAASINSDVEEREYKLQLRDRLTAARDFVRINDSGWQQALRRAFRPPNNLTAWRVHAAFLNWVDEHPDEAHTALLTLWDETLGVSEAVDTFCVGLPPEVSGPGSRTNLASYLVGARGMETYPVYRATAFDTAYRLTEWPHDATWGPGDRYQGALEFLDGFMAACRAKGVALRDRLDAQGLLWRVVSGGRPEGWSEQEIEAYQRFLRGQTVDELAELVEQFRREADYTQGGRPERDGERAELAAALTPDALDDPDIRLLRRLAGPAYGSPGPQPGFNLLLQNDEDVARVADTLRFLLFGSGKIEQRLDSCIRGERKLPKVGEAMLVKALAVSDPQRWIPCYVTTGKVGKVQILQLLGEEPPAGLSPGEAAAASNDRIRARLDPYFPDDPWGMQEFTWWLLHGDRVPESSLKTLADELYLSEEFLEHVLQLMEDKGQVVFYGPPGTGKTYVGRKLAGFIGRGGGTVEKVQFHPSYAYEDFVEGYRPRLVDGQLTYEVVDGPLKRIAATARERPDVTHVLLIDELNRANVSKVLGELLFLLEYRDEEIRLQYSEAPFALPKNLRIIATMNTADRSIALVDAALRRRFHFVPFFPDTPPIDTLLRRWMRDNHPELLWVAEVVDRANEALADRNLAIGPSHFLKPRLDEGTVRRTWQHSVLPFLEEHFFADPDQLNRFELDRLRSATGIEASAPNAGLEGDTTP